MHKGRTDTPRRYLQGHWSTLLVGTLAVAMVAWLALLVWQKASQRVDTSDYEGRIVDRWGRYSESVYGSQPNFILLVEGQDGRRFTVKVDSGIYESAKVGMRIKRSAGQIALVDSDKQTNGTGK